MRVVPRHYLGQRAKETGQFIVFVGPLLSFLVWFACFARGRRRGWRFGSRTVLRQFGVLDSKMLAGDDSATIPVQASRGCLILFLC